MPHAVARLRAARVARSTKPFLARGGSRREHCDRCRLAVGHCLCAWRPTVATRSGMCLLMADVEPLKPSNTGWLVADVVPDTFAFGWARTDADPALLALLHDPRWQPCVVFPGEYAAPGRVVHGVPAVAGSGQAPPGGRSGGRSGDGDGDGDRGGPRPLFVLLDGTWAEARKMFRKSPWLDHLPVLSLQPDRSSTYRLRRSRRDDHFCTSEVAAQCLDLAGDRHAAQVLAAYLDVFTHHYLQARQQLPVDPDAAAHRRLQALLGRADAADWPATPHPPTPP